MEINLDQDLRVINRQTYSLLDWLGDSGSLLDAIFFIAEMLLAPIMTFALNQTLVASLIFFTESRSKDKNKKGGAANKSVGGDFPGKKQLRRMKEEFEGLAIAPGKKFTWWQYCTDRKLGKLINKAHIQIEKELDLQKMIHRLRL